MNIRVDLSQTAVNMTGKEKDEAILDRSRQSKIKLNLLSSSWMIMLYERLKRFTTLT